MSVSDILGQAESIQLLSLEECEGALKAHASDFTEVTSKTYIDQQKSMYRMFLHGVDKTSDESTVGLKLYEEVVQQAKSVGEHFVMIIQQDFDVEAFKTSVVKERISYQVEALKVLAERKVHPPSKDELELLIKIEFEDLVQECIVSRDISDQSTIEPGAEAGDYEDESTVLLEAEIRRRLEPTREQIKLKHEKQFLLDFKAFKLAHAEIEKAKQDYVEAKRRQEQAIVLELLLTHYTEALRQIVSRIKSALDGKFSAIKSKLQDTAVLSVTHKEIANPWDHNHLPGILQLLHDNYYRHSFVPFALFLDDLFGFCQNKDESVEEAATRLQQSMNYCYDRDLWKYFTPDFVFTILLIRGMKNTDGIRSRLMTRLTDFIRSQEMLAKQINGSNLELHLSGGESRTPMFTRVKEFIKDESQSKQMPSSFQTKSTDKEKSQKTTNSNGAFRHIPWSRSNVEHAAAVSEDAVEVAASAGAIKSSVTSSLQQRQFKDQVEPSARVKVKDPISSKEYWYSAVKSLSQLCPACYTSKNEKNASTTCTRTHYPTQCTRCGYFGHKQVMCLQTHHVDGDLLPQKR